MPSTICTKGVRALAFSILLPAAATAAGFPEGCFARDYDDAHLARALEQSVVQVVALAEPDPSEMLDGQLSLRVLFRAEGIGAENALPGVWYDQVFYCRAEGGPALPGWAQAADITCFAECDGGAMQVARWDGAALDLRTGGVFVHPAGGGCDGNAYLAPEGRESVVFRLHPVDLTFCLSE